MGANATQGRGDRMGRHSTLSPRFNRMVGRAVATPPSSAINGANAVLGSELVRPPLRALRVVAPLAVDQKAIFVLARWQRNRPFPDAALILFKTHRGLFPASEVARQQDIIGLRRHIGEGYLLLGDVMLCRNRSPRSFLGLSPA